MAMRALKRFTLGSLLACAWRYRLCNEMSSGGGGSRNASGGGTGAPSPADGSGQRRRTKEQLRAAWCSSCQRALLGAGGEAGM